MNCASIMPVLVYNYRSLAEMAAATSVHAVTIIEPIIQHADWFFPEGENYNINLFTYKKKHLKSLSKHNLCVSI